LFRYLLLVLAFLIGTQAYAQSLSGQEIVEKSIQFHDPEGVWMNTHVIMDLKETRPGASDRNSLVEINNRTSYFNLIRKVDTVTLGYEFYGDQCSLTLNGNLEFNETDAEAHKLNCERGRFLRNYYTYLWGMPMKLLDPGTIVANDIKELIFNGKDSYQVGVTYDKEVGSDTWYFYFSKDDFSLHAYQFYHDESKNDGEFIILKKLMKVGKMNIPKERAWYVNKNDKHLGSDILENTMVKMQ